MRVNTIENIRTWLVLNESKLLERIQDTSCYKWSRWYIDKSIHVFPCVCETRNSACTFAETYHAIWQVNNALTKEGEFIEALIEYSSVIDAKGSLKQWLKSYEELFQEVLLIDDTIKVSLGKNSLESDIIKFSGEKLKHLLKFKELYLHAR
ncbi:hypothetical protein [Croceivirga sp. JEA036]|uniref:hypothetical protein n=1 Tax=Croceivirga sp. JEA036 TaxID=2721162 RepID=UPI00143B37A4|nr:hypothetical protein [Croceivirga sp. JEA036]NJB35330.1 hypothetical protein [Croceivirga sp. JEA036]